jgi:hypothetical protein
LRLPRRDGKSGYHHLIGGVHGGHALRGIDDDGVGSVTPQSQTLLRDAVLADTTWFDSFQDSTLKRI